MTTNSQAVNGARFAQLLKWHERHVGLYSRVAAKTGLSAGYVSMVAHGIRRNGKIAKVLAAELERLLRTAPR